MELLKSKLSMAIIGLLWTLVLTPPVLGLSVGDPVPAVVLLDWQEKEYNINASESRLQLIDFWASWCALCRKGLPEIAKMGETLGKQTLDILAINIDQGKEAADHFLRRFLPNHERMIILRDPEMAVMSKFRLPTMPSAYLVKNGKVRHIMKGCSPEEIESLKQAIDAHSADYE